MARCFYSSCLGECTHNCFASRCLNISLVSLQRRCMLSVALHPFPDLIPCFTQVFCDTLVRPLGCLCQRTALLALWLRRPPLERKIPGSNPACAGIFSGSSHTSDIKIGTPVATLPGVIGSVLGLVGPVSVYCDWVRWKVWSATSVSRGST